jgi:hypothetical protein
MAAMGGNRPFRTRFLGELGDCSGSAQLPSAENLDFRNGGSKPFDLNPRDAACAERE